MHVADDTEAPAAARDVDDAAPSVTAEFRWAAPWAGSLDAARAASASESVARVRGVTGKEAESQLVKQFLCSGIVKVLGFT
jgi:hypothetical protein